MLLPLIELLIVWVFLPDSGDESRPNKMRNRIDREPVRSVQNVFLLSFSFPSPRKYKIHYAWKDRIVLVQLLSERNVTAPSYTRMHDVWLEYQSSGFETQTPSVFLHTVGVSGVERQSIRSMQSIVNDLFISAQTVAYTKIVPSVLSFRSILSWTKTIWPIR